jgi:perosamine synthetase
VKERGLLLIEDCAQAYVGCGYAGDPLADVSMFSFGPIKTNTALGGAVLRIRDPSLLAAVRTLQSRCPVQPRASFLARICKYAGLKLLTYRPLFGGFAAACRLAGRNHDEIVSAAVRGFAGAAFFQRIRQQPGYPLLALLERRLKRFDRRSIEERTAVAETAISLLGEIPRPGTGATGHTHWIFPVLVTEPERFARHLWKHGFDATRGASSLYAVDCDDSSARLGAPEAAAAMRQVVYLPVYPGVTVAEMERLASAIAEFPSAAPSRGAPPGLQSNDSAAQVVHA